MDKSFKDRRSRTDTDTDFGPFDTAYELAGPVRHSSRWPALDNLAVQPSPATRTLSDTRKYIQHYLRSATDCFEEYNNRPGHCAVHADTFLETAEHTCHVKSSVLRSNNLSTSSLPRNSLHHSRSVLQYIDGCWIERIVEEPVLWSLERDILHPHGWWGEW